MTHRQRMLATLRGQATDSIPWAPRMELWAVAQRARSATPPPLAKLDLVGMAKALDVGCRALGCDFVEPRDPQDLALSSLGLANHPHYPYRIALRGLEMTFRHDEHARETVIQTPAGPVRTHITYTDNMRREGVSLPFVEQFAIRSPADFEAVAQVFEHLEVTPTPQGYARFHEHVGEQGLAIAGGMGTSSPMHHIFHELVPPEQFIYLYMDERAALHDLAQRMAPFFEKLLDAILQCRAEVMFWGGNYDQNLTWPDFFADEIAPWLRHVADRAHAAGKFLLTHTDGENEKLLPLYPPCGFDVAESVCTAPMMRNTLAEIRAGMGPNVTVWGGIPSVALLKDSMDDATFTRFLDDTFAELGTGERLMFGVSDMVPPDADLDRLEQIKQRVAAFGPVRPAARP